MTGEAAVVIILVAGAIWFFWPSGVSKAKPDIINSVSEEEAEEEEIEAVIKMGEADFVRAMPSLASEHVMKGAVMKLVMMGDSEHWTAFKDYYQNEKISDPVQSYVADALDRRGEVVGEFYDRLYAMCLEELKVDDSPDESLLDVIIRSNRPLAADEFHKPEWHKFEESGRLETILSGMNRHRLLLDRNVVMKLLERAEAFLATFDNERAETDFIYEFGYERAGQAVAALLSSLQLRNDSEFESNAFRWLTHQYLGDYASILIAEAIVRFHGINSVYDAMVDRYGEPRGWVHVDDLETLAKDFRKRDQTYKVWRSLGNLDGGVNNGGFEGYFSNALGFQFLTAIESARTVGDYDVAKVLDDLREELAARGFAGDYSSQDYERLEESLEDILHSYSTRYCEAAKNLLARSELYLASKLCGVDLLARIPDSHESD